MTIFTRAIRSGAVLGLAAVVALASPLAAQDLTDLKRRGVLGERIDGYLAPVADDPAADLVRFVNEINAERRARYEAIARQNGTDPQAVGQIAGRKVIERAPTGRFVMGTDGVWRRK